MARLSTDLIQAAKIISETIKVLSQIKKNSDRTETILSIFISLASNKFLL